MGLAAHDTMSTHLAHARTDSVCVAAERIASIDVFRGITMAVMIFVNALGEVGGLPWWTHHAKADWDVMTYVDMVFPFFLFAIGLSLPLAVERRYKRRPSSAALWAHVLVRSASLVVLGLMLANVAQADQGLMGISGELWALLGILCAALFLLDYAALKRLQPYARRLQAIGIGGLVILFGIFRRSVDGRSAWIDFSYPEILGLIGFTYFSAALLYIPTRRWKWAPAIWFILLTALCVLSTDRVAVVRLDLPLYIWPFGNGAMCSITMAGVVASTFLYDAVKGTHERKGVRKAVAFSLILLLAGWALTSLGVSKIRATPTWSLWSSGAAVLVFALLYGICDVKQWRRWAAPVHAAGANTLATYLLPDTWIFLMFALGGSLYAEIFPYGWPGAIKSFVFTCVILWLASLLTRARIRLQL